MASTRWASLEVAMSACKVLLVTALVAACGAADAAIVHRCRAADGSLVYRDAPCAIGEATIERREFAEPAPVAPVSTRSGRATASAPAHTAGQGAAARASGRGSVVHGAQRAERIVTHRAQ